jgi:hypothetical protein
MIINNNKLRIDITHEKKNNVEYLTKNLQGRKAVLT